MTATPPAGGPTPGPDYQGPAQPWAAPDQRTWGTPEPPAQPWGPPAQQAQTWSTQPNQASQPPPGQPWQAPAPGAQQPWQPPAAGSPQWGPVTPNSSAPAPPENVGRGVLFSLGSLIVGAGLAILFSWGGFIASISAIAAAYAALWLYVKGAGAAPRKGAIPLLVVVLLGILAQFLAVVGFGVWRVSRGRGAGQWQYVLSSMFNPAVWEGYALEGVMIVAFSLLGIFGTIRGLVANRR